MEARPIASLTALELLGVGDGAMIAALLVPCLDSLQVLMLEVIGVSSGYDRGSTPDHRLPYSLS